MDTRSLVDDSRRFSPIHPDDHAGYLWIATLAGLVYSLMAIGGRVRVKWGMYATDDYLTGLATVAELGQSASLISGLKHGLAKFNSITTEASWRSTSKQSFFVSQLLSIAVLCLAKCSITWLFLRVLFDTGRSYKAIKVYLVLNVLWGVAAIIGLAADCNASTILTTQHITQCPEQFLRWQIITAFDIITDVIACLLPLFLVWNLNMPFGLKFQVVAAFAFRAPLVIFSALHLASIRNYQGSTEPQFAITTALLFQQAMVAWSLISATIPNLGSFIKSFSMGLGVPMGLERNGTSLHSAYALQTIGGSAVGGRPRETCSEGAANSDVEDERDGHDTLRPDNAQYRASIVHSACVHDKTARRSLSRSGSRELIIRKEVEWDVSHETR
ncbi:hypothetical protein VMCG_00384 [Cytospora schulzeri]|uniref:Rhodopsin domain-containing protein n=1 Tax=Cytospora schulzeri TaxID=448051 RepID=A0A423X8G9_9PEZI|nr:hypothetical protein VMCG_00384 [Valsa malicola]